MCAFSTSAWLYLEKAKATLSLKLIQKGCFLLKTNRTLRTCWYLGMAPGVLKLRKSSLSCQDFEEKYFFYLMEIWFDLIWSDLWNFQFFYDASWATILKTALREVDNVSFSAHSCEWVGLTQLLVPKQQQQQLMQGAIFLTSSSGLCLLQEAVIPLPCHSLWSSGYRQQCSALLIFT